LTGLLISSAFGFTGLLISPAFGLAGGLADDTVGWTGFFSCFTSTFEVSTLEVFDPIC